MGYIETKEQVLQDMDKVLSSIPDMFDDDREKFYRSNYLFELFIRIEDVMKQTPEITDAEKGDLIKGFTKIRQSGKMNLHLLQVPSFIQLMFDLIRGDYPEYPIPELKLSFKDFEARLNDSGWQKNSTLQNSNRGTGNQEPEINNIYRSNTSYSGTDMVCSINIPGREPVVFGELSQLSYSVFREKVPVRAIGNVRMKGYTRGMRTITGVLGFTVFDESVVYQAMKDIRKAGYRLLMDEMPTFDITLSMANEYGSRSKIVLYGVSTFTEGMVMSVDDMYTQNVYEFYALDINPMERMEE